MAMKALPILLANVVNRADVGMIQSRSGLGLAVETLQCLRRPWRPLQAGTSGPQNGQPGVLGLVHHTHPAAPELLDDAVVRDGLADHLPECYGVRSGMSM